MLTAAGSGTEGDGAAVYASCIAEQMRQKSSARPAGLWLAGTAGASGKAPPILDPATPMML